MNDRITEAFNQIHAEDELKINTRKFLSEKKSKQNTSQVRFRKRHIAAIICFCFVLIGAAGYYSYFTPISAISVDVNPSIELGINRFDKVISVKGFNEDGRMLVSSLNIRFLNYQDALNQILTNENIQKYVNKNQLISITVIGQNEKKSNEMLANVSSCTNSSYGNIHCCSGDSEEAKAAHEAGMSFGKYKAFLELQQFDPDIKVEDIQNLTMHQIRDRIDAFSQDMEGNIQNDTAGEEESGAESGNGYRHGCGQGKNSGQGHKNCN